MARQQTIDLNQSFVPQGSNLPEVTPNVVASPVALGVSDEGLRKADQLARDMAAFTGSFERFSQQQSQEVIRTEHEQAMMDYVKDPEAKPVFDQSQSAFYQQARIKLFAETAKNQTAQRLTTLVEDLKNNPEKFEGQNPKQVLAKFYEDNLAGLDDPDVAAVVFPHIQKMMMAAEGDLADSQKALAQRRVLESANTAVDSLFVRVGEDGSRTPVVPAPQDMWSVIGQMVRSGIPKDQALSLMADRIKYSSRAEGQLNAPDLFKTASPDGVSWSNTPEGKHKFRDTVTSELADQATKREAIRMEADQRQRDAQQEQYAANKSAILFNAKNRGELDTGSDAFKALSIPDQHDAIEAQFNFQKTRAREMAEQALATEVAATGMKADQLVNTPKEHAASVLAKKTEWTNKWNSTLKRAADRIKAGEPEAQVFADNEVGSLRHTVQEILQDHANGNTTVSLDFLKVQTTDVHLLPTAAANNGKIPEKAALSFMVFDAVQKNPGLSGSAQKLFGSDEYMFMTTWHKAAERQGTSSNSLVTAYNQVSEAWKAPAAPDIAREAQSRTADLQKKVTTAVVGRFQEWGGWFDAMDPDMTKTVVSRYLTRETLAALYVKARGDEQATIDAATDLISDNFVRVDGSIGDGNWGRNFLIPKLTDPIQKAMEKQGADMRGFDPNKWPDMYQNLTNGLTANMRRDGTFGVRENSKVSYLPSPDGAFLQVFVDGVQASQIPMSLAVTAWNARLVQENSADASVFRPWRRLDAATQAQAEANKPAPDASDLKRYGRVVAMGPLGAIGEAVTRALPAAKAMFSPSEFLDRKTAEFLAPHQKKYTEDMVSINAARSREAMTPNTATASVAAPKPKQSAPTVAAPAVPIGPAVSKPEKVRKDTQGKLAELAGTQPPSVPLPKEGVKSPLPPMPTPMDVPPELLKQLQGK